MSDETKSYINYLEGRLSENNINSKDSILAMRTTKRTQRVMPEGVIIDVDAINEGFYFDPK